MATSQKPPPRSRRRSLIPSPYDVVDLASTVAKDSTNRAAQYVSAMEHYLGVHFDRKTRVLAMAAVSGLAISTAIVAKAGSVPSSPTMKQMMDTNTSEQAKKYEALTQQYQQLRDEHDLMILDKNKSEKEYFVLQQKHEQVETEHRAHQRESDESIAKFLAQIQFYEGEQKHNEDSKTSANARIVQLETDLETTSFSRTAEADHLRDSLINLQAQLEDRSVRLNSLELELSRNLTDKSVSTRNVEEVRDELHKVNNKIGDMQAEEIEQLKRHQEQCEAYEEQLRHANSTVAALNMQISGLQDQQSENIRFTETYEAKLRSLEAEHASTRQVLGSTHADYRELQNKFQALQSELTRASSELENLKSSYGSQIKGLQSQFNDTQNSHLQNIKEITKQMENLNSQHQTEIEDHHKKYDISLQEGRGLQDELEKLNTEYERARQEFDANIRDKNTTINELTSQLKQAEDVTRQTEQHILTEHAHLMHEKDQRISLVEEQHHRHIEEIDDLHTYELDMLRQELEKLRTDVNKAELRSDALNLSTDKKIEHQHSKTNSVPSAGSDSQEAIARSNQEINSLDVQEQRLARFRASQFFDRQRDSRSGIVSNLTHDEQSGRDGESLHDRGSYSGKKLGRLIGTENDMTSEDPIMYQEQTQYMTSQGYEIQQSKIPLPSTPTSPATRPRSGSSAARSAVSSGSRTAGGSHFVEAMTSTSNTSTPVREKGFRSLLRRASGKFKSPESSGKSISGGSPAANFSS